MIKRHNTLSIDVGQSLLSSTIKRFRLVGYAVVLLSFVGGAYPAEEGAHVHEHEDTVVAPEHAPTTNAICPVMTGKKIDPDIFTDYQGKRVYFCCLSCKAAFEKNPQEYLALLPQFGGVEASAGHDHGGHGSGLTLAGLIKPMGVIALSLLALTVSAALLRRKRPRLLLKWHKRLGITTLALAVIHLVLVLIAH